MRDLDPVIDLIGEVTGEGDAAVKKACLKAIADLRREFEDHCAFLERRLESLEAVFRRGVWATPAELSHLERRVTVIEEKARGPGGLKLVS